MPLQPQPFPLPFETGQDDKSDPRWVRVGAQTSLTNGHLARTGSIRKRNGFGVLGASGSYTSKSVYSHTIAADTYQRILPVANSAAVINSGRLWQLANTTKALTDMDAVTPFVITRRPVDATSNAITSYDCAAMPDGRVLIAYCAAALLYVSIYDPSNDAVVTNVPTTVAADYVRLATVTGNNNVFFVTQTTATPSHLNFYTYDPTQLTVTAIGSALTDCGGAARFDATSWDGTSPPATFILAYGTNANTWKLISYNVNTNIATATTFTPAGVSPVTANIAVRATAGESIWVAHQDNINAGLSPSLLRCVGLDPNSYVVTTTDTQLDSNNGQNSARISVERIDSTHAMVAWSINPAYGMSTRWNRIAFSSGALGQIRTMQQMGLSSKLFTVNGSIYSVVTFSSSNSPPVITAGSAAAQPTPSSYVIDMLASDSTTVNQTAQLRGNIAPRIVNANGTTTGATLVSTVGIVGRNSFVPLPTIRSATDPNGLDLVKVTRSYAAHQSARLGPCSYISGATPCVYDGKRVTELGFTYPIAALGLTANNAGGSMADGTYTYAYVWEWRDATGQRKQSQPVFSTGQTISGGGGNGSVSMSTGIPDLSLTLCQDSESGWTPNVALAIYRTIPSVAAGIYCRLYTSDVPSTVLSLPYGTGTISYTDTATDASIQSNERLYTEGNVLSGQIPSSMTCLISHQGRLYGIGDDETTIWVSTAWDGGTSQPRFNDSLVLNVPDGGRVTALASMDASLVIFKKDAIYIISGDGPDEAGAGASWTPARLVPSDVGCDADWRAVCTTPMGVVFQHGSRLYMLSRGLEVQYFSRPVESELSSFPVVTSIVLVPDQQQLRVTCKTADGSHSGRVLVFDYVANAWSVYTLHDSDSATSNFCPDSACYATSGYVFVGGSGSPWFETVGTYLDQGATWITLSVESAWLKPASILGYVRFRWAQLLAEKGTDADITFSIADDYNDTYAQASTLTAQDLNDGQFTKKGEIKAHIVRQKSSAIRIKISDATPTNGTVGTGQGYNLLGLMVEGGIKKGLRKLPQTQAL